MSSIFMLLSGVLLLVLWWYVTTERLSFHVDRTRQELFKVRDELFDLALEGEIPSNSKAYRISRDYFNGMIRFIHELSFLRAIIIMFTYKYSEQKIIMKNFDVFFEEELNKIPVSSKKLIQERMEKMHEIAAMHLLRISFVLQILIILMFPILTLVFLCMFVVQGTYKGFKNLFYKAWLRELDFEALKLASPA